MTTLFQQAICDLAQELPGPLLARFCSLLENAPQHVPLDLKTVHRVLVQHQSREKIDSFVGLWRAECPHLSPDVVASSLRCAHLMSERCALSPALELVWTGPGSASLRRIDAALLHVIESARRDLWLVTFAAFHVESLSRALHQAAARGVTIRFVAETSEHNDQMKSGFMEEFKDALPAQTQWYVWPRDNRPLNEKGQSGSLHAKCAVADAAVALVSSANFTGHALLLNIEMGVLINGGEVPAEIDEHLHQLVNSEVWVASS